jgi:hypothetical protein
MKQINIWLSILLVCLACTDVSARESRMSARFRERVETIVLCNGGTTTGGVDRERYLFFKRAAKQLGMDLNASYVPLNENAIDEGVAGYSGYDGYIKPRNRKIKIFGFDLMAIYFDPQNEHFWALLNASEEEILRLVAKKVTLGDDGKRWNPLYIEYDKDMPKSWEGEQPKRKRYCGGTRTSYMYHAGKHTAHGGFNSNRVIFAPPGRGTFSTYATEVESCEDTKSEWFIGLCKQFDRTPLTWVGCGQTTEEAVDYWVEVERGECRPEEFPIKRLPIEEILSRKKKGNPGE